MKARKRLIFSSLIAGALIFSISSCSKDKSTTSTSTDATAAQDISTVDNISNDIQGMGDQAMSSPCW